MKYWRTFSQKIRQVPPGPLIIISLVLLVVIGLLSLLFGAATLSFEDVWGLHDIVKYIRIPRMLAAIFAGMGLAGAGVILQTLLANPLAGPNIIGVNSGAGFFAILSCLLVPLAPALQPVAAFVGSLVAVLFIYTLARKTGASKVAILLAGVILNSLFNAATEALYTFFPELLSNVAAFRSGGLSSIQTSVLYPAIILIVVTCLLVWIKADALELLSLGDEVAHSLGLPVKKSRFLFLLGAACMAGAAVSFAGLIGFLGLIVPHAIRAIVGSETRYLFPLSILWGGIFMVVCDTFARCAFAPFELSVGIVLSMIGAPIFIWILLSKKKMV